MGTNYYWYERPPCGECGGLPGRVHIGKNSAGWVFALHVYPYSEHDWPLYEGLNPPQNWADWKALLLRPGSYIKDEYNQEIDAQDVIDLCESKPGRIGNYDADFLIQNQAEVTKRGLLRHPVDGRRYVGWPPGEETCAYYVGDFS